MASAMAIVLTVESPADASSEKLTRRHIMLKFDRNAMCHFKVVDLSEDSQPLTDGMHTDFLQALVIEQGEDFS